MELSWLETFIELAESNSVRTAASRLGISPATASERISALEDELGTKLLIRSSRGSELSEAGKLYVRSARHILESWDNILSLIKPMDTTQFLRLSIGLPEHVMIPMLGRCLDRFIAAHPQIELNLFSDQEVGIDSSLKDNTTDIFFAFEPSAEVRKNRKAYPVHHTQMGILVPGDHRLAFRKSVSLNELDGETFILYPSFHDSELYSFQKKMLRTSGIRYLEYGGHFSASLFPLTVKMGCGIALFPRIMKRGLTPRTLFLELTDEICQCDIYMIYNPANSNPALKLFLDEFGDQKGSDEL